MQFEHLESIWWVALAIPMFGAYLSFVVWKRKVAERIGNPELVNRMAEGHSPRLQVIRAVLVIVAVALLAIAYAQPQWGETNRPIKRTGIDVVFALDLSKSMLARDVNPNRLEAAKNEIRTAMSLMGGDRVGLVVFTSISFQQSPLTTDYGAIRFYLKKLKPEQMPMGGTSVGRALADSVELLTGQSASRDEDGDAPDMKRAENQIIVIFTDGEDHESNPMLTAQKAADQNIRIVTVGIGSTSGERIPVYKADGTLAGFTRDRSGNLVRTKLDEETLQRIAQTTGGEYIRYTGENSVANALVEYVNKLEKSEIETLLKSRYKERYYVFVFPALLLLLIAGFLGERRKSPAISRKLTVLLILAVTTFGCEDAFRAKLSSVEKGISALAKDDGSGALEAFQKAETEIPANPQLHYNLGLAHLELGEHELAQQKFTRALETDDLTLRFDATVNLGLTLAAQELWQDALDTFKGAIKLGLQNPGVIDTDRMKMAAQNLETAFHKLYPPCATLEDELEDNDTAQTASKLPEGEKKKLALCGLDADWFQVPAIPGSTVAVTAKFRVLRNTPDPEMPFMTAPTDVKIGLFTPDGQTAIAVDQGLDEDDVSNVKTVTREISRLEVDESMLQGGNMLFLKVSAAEFREFEYDVNIVSIPPCEALQETTEPNDTPEQAMPLETTPVHLCKGDRDFFKVSLQPDESFFVDLIPGDDAETETKPALKFSMYAADSGKLLASSIDEGGVITGGIRNFEGGDVVIEVSGEAESQGPYELRHYRFPLCPEGDDRLEENDSAETPAELNPEEPMTRYLRLCPGDPDFFTLPIDEKSKKVELGLALIAIPKSEDPAELTEFSLDLLSTSGDQIIAESQAVEVPDETAVPLTRALVQEDFEEKTALIRVDSEAGDFYHLVQLNPQKPPPQDQQQEDQEQNQDEGDNQDEQQDESDDPQEKEKDNEGGQDEQEKEQSENSEGKDEQDPEEEKRESGEPEEEQQQEQQEQQEAQQAQANPAEETEDPNQQRIGDILRALEETDDNFQMKKALQDRPDRFIDKDW